MQKRYSQRWNMWRIMQGVWLNHLDKKRSYKLYLRLISDYEPVLLAIPCTNEHPLLYHMNIDFKGIASFFERAITINEAGESMARFLLNAYFNGHPGSYALLVKLLSINPQARESMPWLVSEDILDSDKLKKKGWKVLSYLLNFDDPKLGKQQEIVFFHFPMVVDRYLINYMDKYLCSYIGKLRGGNFYDYLMKIIPSAPRECLKWFFKSNPQLPVNEYSNTKQIEVLIHTYNGIRKYDLKDPFLEKAMDMFDEMLQVPEHRVGKIRPFLDEITS